MSKTARGVTNGSAWRKTKGSYLSQQIENLQDQGDMYTKKIEIERRRNEDLDKKIKRARSKLLTAQKDIGGVNAAQEGMVSKAKKLRTYENRLEKTLRDYNTTFNYNKTLKQTIQNLRREQQQQFQIRDKLEKELAGKKNQMVQTIVAQQAATDARDKAQRQVEALRQQIAEEIEEFEAEYQERYEELQDERDAHKALGIQTNKKKDTANDTAKGEDYKLGNMSTQEEKKMRGQNNKAYWSIAKKEVDLKRQTERVQTYEEAFAKIQQETGISSIDEMVTAFITAEEENFSLFNMINELNREMETLEVENGDIKSQIETLKAQQGGGKSRVGMKKYLERQIEVSNEKAVLYKEKLDSALKVIDSMKTGIISIFQKVGCNDEALGQQLASTGVTDMNLTQFLGIIEQRINEIVQMNSTFQDKDGTGQRKADTPMNTKSMADEDEGASYPSFTKPDFTGKKKVRK